MALPTASINLIRAGTQLAGEKVGAGRSILLLHAGGETRDVWRPVMQDLARRGYASQAYDQRGHGESGGSTRDGFLAYGEDAEAMIEAMDRPVVVGASLGGLALMLALDSCEPNVAGLVLVDVTPAPDPERARAYLAPRVGLGASPLVDDILSRSEVLTRIVAGLRLPVMLVCAGLLSPLGTDGREQFSRLCPSARIVVVPQAGHLVARDAPQELARLVADFSDRIQT